MKYLRVVIGTLFVVAIAVFFALFAVQIAYGQVTTVAVPLIEVYHGEPGEVIPVTTVTAPVGFDCVVTLSDVNNDSEHPNTDVIVGSIVFQDIERFAFSSETRSFPSEGDIPVAVRIGNDGVASMGFL